MPGAFAMALSRKRRRGYADGGDVDAGTWDNPDTQTQAAQPQGAMAAATAPPADLAPAEKIALAQRGIANLQQQQAARSILQAGNTGGSPLLNGMLGGSTVTDPSKAPDATNLPLLAAAGAMLSPTHSGTFSEALGNAFKAAVPVTEQQRQLAENAQLRKAQMDNNAAIWGSRVGVQQDANTIRAQRVSDQATIAARVADLKQQGLDDLSAHRQALEDLGSGKLDAYRERTTEMGTAAAGRTNLSQQALDLRKQAFDALVSQRGITNDRNAQNDLATQLSRMTDEQIRAINAGKNPLTGAVPTADQAGATVNKLRANSSASLGQPKPANAAPLPLPQTKSDLRDGITYGTARGPARWDAKGDQFVPVGQ